MTTLYVNDGTVTTASQSLEQDYLAYVDGGAAFTVNNGIDYTLATPTVLDTTFQIGSTTASGAAASELVLDAGTVGGSSTFKFENIHSTLVIGLDNLGTIDIQTTDLAAPTLVSNPNLYQPLIDHFGGTLSNFKLGDTIIVDTLVDAKFVLHSIGSSIVDVEEVSDPTIVLGELTFSSYASAAVAMGNTLSLQDDVVVCFNEGTNIRTPEGEVRVEALRPGDMVWSAIRNRAVPVLWTGHRRLDCRRHPDPRSAWPVRIAADAFGPGQPAADLLVSPAHAICVPWFGEVLIRAEDLVNGATVTQEPVDAVTYWHVEVPGHDVLLANGLPAESYIDVQNRGFFVESDVVALGGRLEFVAQDAAAFCRPFADAAMLRDVRERLAARAEAAGWRQRFEVSPLLVADGCLAPIQIEEGAVTFGFASSAREALLRVPAYQPLDLGVADARRLGLAIVGIEVSGGGQARQVELDDARLRAGFYPVEAGAGGRWRWTQDEAVFDGALWAGLEGEITLRLMVSQGALRGWAAPALVALAAAA